LFIFSYVQDKNHPVETIK